MSGFHYINNISNICNRLTGQGETLPVDNAPHPTGGSGLTCNHVDPPRTPQVHVDVVNPLASPTYQPVHHK